MSNDAKPVLPDARTRAADLSSEAEIEILIRSVARERQGRKQAEHLDRRTSQTRTGNVAPKCLRTAILGCPEHGS